MKTVIFGNSGSGKSTLAKQLSTQGKLAHLDLDTIAWLDVSPPERAPLAESESIIQQFITDNISWVIEGCYSDLLSCAAPFATNMIYLNLPVNSCVENARTRAWEPHKYASKKVQDDNLPMLVNWITNYETRRDTFSKNAHEQVFENFKGQKTMYTSNAHDTIAQDTD